MSSYPASFHYFDLFFLPGKYYLANAPILAVHYTYYCCSTLSALLVATLSLERAVALGWPLRATVFTRRRTLMWMAGLLLVTLALYLPLLTGDFMLYYNRVCLLQY